MTQARTKGNPGSKAQSDRADARAASLAPVLTKLRSGGLKSPRALAALVVFDVKQAARQWCPKAIERLAQLMHSADERVAAMACEALLSRGYGKPQVTVEATTIHKFAVVPEVMEESEWLARRGQPVLEGKAAREKCPDAATTLDRTEADEPDPNKLN